MPRSSGRHWLPGEPGSARLPRGNWVAALRRFVGSPSMRPTPGFRGAAGHFFGSRNSSIAGVCCVLRPYGTAPASFAIGMLLPGHPSGSRTAGSVGLIIANRPLAGKFRVNY